MGQGLWQRISRRMVISGGAVSAGGALLTAIADGRQATAQGTHAGHGPGGLAVTRGRHDAHGRMLAVGEVDSTRNGFDPTAMLTDWQTGTVSQLPDGRTLRSFEVIAQDKEIEIAPGLFFPAWAYNGRVPGPCLRSKQGDRLRIVFRNE